jgi:hypothetical protein
VQGAEAADEALRKLRDLLAVSDREVARILARMDTERGSSRLVTDAQAVANGRAVSRQLREAIAALENDATTILRDASIKAARDEATRVGFTFDPEAAARIQEIIRNREAEIVEIFGDARESVARAVRVATTTGADLGTLLDQVASDVRNTVRRAQSAVDSAAMASGRQTTILDAEEAGEETDTEIVYAYAGPVDSKTRPFCLEHITSLTQRAYALSYLERADNGARQPKPAALYLGGYNCRHQLAPLTVAQARERGLEIVR